MPVGKNKRLNMDKKDFDKMMRDLQSSKKHNVSDKKIIGNARQAEKLTGRKRADQSARMSGEKNSMAGKEHPNKGKALPQIGRPGVAKPEGFGDKISKARKGVPNLKALGVERPDHSAAMKDPARNKGAQTMRETMTCPHCGKTANVPNYKRWHGDNCKIKGVK